MRRRFTLLVAATLFAGPAAAAETVTVQSLIGDGYTVASSWMSQIGPAIMLQKSGKLYLCFVTERPDTPDLVTKYCKPVH